MKKLREKKLIYKLVSISIELFMTYYRQYESKKENFIAFGAVPTMLQVEAKQRSNQINKD